MGGRAFPQLFCPRIARKLYVKARDQAFDALTQFFTHITVPTEFPSKTDFGDVDFLVAGPRGADFLAKFPYPTMVKKIAKALGTTHGRQGFLTKDCMYFAIPCPGREDEFHIQIDVKVCEDPELFAWTKFQLNYASSGKIIGSMIKPLGLTINPEGLWIRVEEMEDANSADSMVFLSREPRDALKIIGLDGSILDESLAKNEELYVFLTNSWIFNPAHFAERMKDAHYVRHLKERSKAWVYFVTKWIAERYPSYQLPSQLDKDVGDWYQIKRIIMRESVLTMFPSAAEVYYGKRRAHLKREEETRLRALIMSVLPTDDDGWTQDIPQPPIVRKPAMLENSDADDSTPSRDDVSIQVLNTPVPIPCSEGADSTNGMWEPNSPTSSIASSTTLASSIDAREVTLYLEPLPRPVPTGQEHVSRPPPRSMSHEAKLVCLARWTLFQPDNGTLCLATEPREKKFEMCWADSGASDDVLTRWAKEMWWVIWNRQHWVNWNGIWRHKMAKEDKKAAKEAEERAATTAATVAEQAGKGDKHSEGF